MLLSLSKIVFVLNLCLSVGIYIILINPKLGTTCDINLNKNGKALHTAGAVN